MVVERSFHYSYLAPLLTVVADRICSAPSIVTQAGWAVEADLLSSMCLEVVFAFARPVISPVLPELSLSFPLHRRVHEARHIPERPVSDRNSWIITIE